MQWLTANSTALTFLLAIALFLWPIIQFVLTRKREAAWREFEIYHKLTKELVQPDPDTKMMWLDRQIAVVFELRHFPRYRELTVRTLRGLREQWVTTKANERLIEELDMTLAILEK